MNELFKRIFIYKVGEFQTSYVRFMYRVIQDNASVAQFVHSTR